MYRFIALFVREQSSEAQSLLASLSKAIDRNYPDGRVVLERNGLTVMDWPDVTSNMKHHLLDGGDGIILGHLFTPKPGGSDERPSARAPQYLSESDSRKITGTDGAWLCEKFWGSYVAFLPSRTQRGLTAFRSPHGILSCFHYSIGDISVFFSDFTVMHMLQNYGLELDWTYAPLYLHYAYWSSERTAYKDLDLLFHAQRLKLSGSRKVVDFLWDPVQFARERSDDPTETTIKKLRNTVFACFGTWANVYPDMLLALSGGVDSSIVAGVLAKLQNRPKVQCFTVFDRSSLGDERCYAELTARRAGFNLAAIESEPTGSNYTDFLNYPKIPWPSLISTNHDKELKLESLAKAHGASSLVNGDGGDVLFGLFLDNLAAQDYVFDHGFDGSTLRVAMESARLSETSLWAALAAMVRTRFGDDAIRHQEKNYAHLLAWGVTAEAAAHIARVRPSAPWKNTSCGLPPGKRAQIATVMADLHYINPDPKRHFLEPVHPLFSQPIVETCLRIPLYIHQLDGRERGLARRAFSDCLADEVRLRQFKSHGTTFMYNLVAGHRKFIAEFLLDGLLVKKGIIDRKAIEPVCIHAAHTSPLHYSRLAWFTCVEAWVRAWS